MPDPVASGCSLQAVEPGSYVLTGDLGLDSAAAILARGESEFAGQRHVEVDLAGVTDADSAGLAVLIEWVRRARNDGRTIGYRSMPARLAAIARIGGVGGLLPLAR